MSNLRQIVLDTETTGLSPEEGHRIIEIGCVELVERRFTDRTFHVYLNPDRVIDAGAIEVHGITNEFLSDKPRFADVVDEFVEFIQGAELIIHNAPFDVGFIDAELKKLGKQYQTTHHYSTVLDTLVLARKTYPGQRNSLDALCKRLGVTHHERTLHGALLDSEILADVYLRMTGGQGALSLQEKSDNPEHSNHNQDISNPLSDSSDKSVNIKVIEASQEESVAHQEFLQMMSKKGSTPIWHQVIPGMTPDV